MKSVSPLPNPSIRKERKQEGGEGGEEGGRIRPIH